MSEKPDARYFETSEALLRHIQEKSDDIESVQIPLFSPVSLGTPVKVRKTFDCVGMMVKYTDGRSSLISAEDAELVLNDGILTRMRIKIHLMKPET